MTFPACSGFPEEEGANFTPPTLGEFMKKQTGETRRLREARAFATVAREARLFHEKKAHQYGLDTARGLAHFHASRIYTREAGSRLQEMFENGGEVGELPSSAVMKANKAAINFHKGQAEKAGLDSDVGHAHVAAMEHHMDILNKAKKQKEAQIGEASEGGPGSGPRPGHGKGAKTFKAGEKVVLPANKKEGWPREEGKVEGSSGKNMYIVRVKPTDKDDDGIREVHANDMAKFGKESQREAIHGYSGKQSPVPVPKKSEQPSEDIRQNLPAVPLKRLQQKRAACKAAGGTYGAHAGKIHASGEALTKQHKKQGMLKVAQKHQGEGRLDVAARIRRKAIDKFGECAPSPIEKQIEDDLIFKGKRTKRESGRRRHL